MNKGHLKHLQDNNTVQGIGVIELERLYDKCNWLINEILEADCNTYYSELEKEITKTEAEIKRKLTELFNNK